MDKFLLQNKTALITGGSSGLGRAATILFSSLGADVLFSGRDKDNLELTLNESNKVKKNGDQRLEYFIADLKQEEGVKKLSEYALSNFPKIDILVNNAGILKNDNIENFSLSMYDEIMTINVRSVILLTNLLSKQLIANKGRIINVSSIAGTRSFPNLMSYCISKAALEQLTGCMALDLAPKGVRVNAVSPGVIVTEVHKRAGMDLETYEKFLEHSKSTHALGRVGEAEEVAYSIAFLASDASSFTTAAVLPICGGRFALCPR